MSGMMRYKKSTRGDVQEVPWRKVLDGFYAHCRENATKGEDIPEAILAYYCKRYFDFDDVDDFCQDSLDTSNVWKLLELAEQYDKFPPWVRSTMRSKAGDVLWGGAPPARDVAKPAYGGRPKGSRDMDPTTPKEEPLSTTIKVSELQFDSKVTELDKAFQEAAGWLKGSRYTRPPYIPLSDEEMALLLAGIQERYPQMLGYGGLS